ncbi:kinase-regulated stress-responsive transcription factor skn7 [Savitreella phatthalungensis]
MSPGSTFEYTEDPLESAPSASTSPGEASHSLYARQRSLGNSPVVMVTTDMQGSTSPLISPPVRDEASIVSSPAAQDSENFAGLSNCDNGALGQRHQAAFVSKLYSMVEDASIPTLYWGESGHTFIVSSPNEFSKCLSNFFKHNNWQSFVRQLNMYQFHKVNDVFHSNSNPGPSENSAWEFKHTCFKRGRLDLLNGIKRKASKPSHSSHRDAFSTSGIKEQTIFGASITSQATTHSPSYGYNGHSIHQPSHPGPPAGLLGTGTSQRSDHWLELMNQRLAAGEEAQRMLMDQNAAMFGVLRSYQNILSGMANILAVVSPNAATQAISNDLHTLNHHLKHMQFPNRQAVASPVPSAMWQLPHSPLSSQSLGSPPASYFNSHSAAETRDQDYFRQVNGRVTGNSGTIAHLSHPASVGPVLKTTSAAASAPKNSPASQTALDAARSPQIDGSRIRSPLLAPLAPLQQHLSSSSSHNESGAHRPPMHWPHAMPSPPLGETSIRTSATSNVRNDLPALPSPRSDQPEIGKRPMLGLRGTSLQSLLNDDDAAEARKRAKLV